MTQRLGISLLGLLLMCSLTACSSDGGGMPFAKKSPAEKMGWKLGCQAWTFRKMTLTETLETLKSLDIHYIEIYPGQSFSPEKRDVKFDHNSSDELIAEFLAACKKNNVTPVSYGVAALTKDEAQVRKVFAFGKKLGLLNIVSEPPPEAIPMIDTVATEYQINMAIHDHPKPSHYWDCQSVIDVCQGRSKRIGACADVGHWYRSGLVPLDCLKKLEGRILEFHLKDIEENKEDVPWGSGKCDMHAMLTEMKRQNFKGVFSIEYESGEGAELMSNVKLCIAYWNQVTAELAK